MNYSLKLWRAEIAAQVGRVAERSRFKKVPGASARLHALALTEDLRFSFCVDDSAPSEIPGDMDRTRQF